MLYTDFTEKLLGLQNLKVTKIEKNEKAVCIYAELPRKTHNWSCRYAFSRFATAQKVKVLRTAQGLAENSQNQTKKFFKAPAKARKLLSLFSIVLIAYFLKKSNRNNRSAEKSCRNADFLRKLLFSFSF